MRVEELPGKEGKGMSRERKEGLDGKVRKAIAIV